MTGRPSRLRRLVRWRYLRWAVAVPAIPLALWACTSHPLEEPKPLPEQQTDLYYEVNPIRDLDILVMVDNSPSMEQEQANLGRNFPALIGELKKIPGGLPNVHIGVISSDLGAGPAVVQQCRPTGDRGIFQNGAGKNCGLDPNSRFIVSFNNGSQNNFTGNLENVFSCIASLGVNGCGYEHQLQATRVALYEMTTPENKGFLRENAYLAIILLTDEDDCSGTQDSNFYGDLPEYNGTTASFRCSHTGHLCDGKTPPAAEFMSPLANCKANDKPRTIPVAEIVTSIRALKKRPDQQILVSAIFGWPQNPAAATYAYRRRNNQVDVSPICQSAGNGEAAPGLRIKEFVDSFGNNGIGFSICQDDFRPAMQKIGEKLAVLLGTPCVAAPPVDTNPQQAGLQAECAVVDKYPAGAGFRDEPLPQCGAGAGNSPCWSLVPDITCGGGYKVQVDRKGQMAPPGTQQSIKCLTCPPGVKRQGCP